MKLLIGLRLALGEDRPLPYAASLPVREGVVSNKGTASNAIRQLVAFGVVRYAGRLKPRRNGLDGTKLYAPPAADPCAPAEGEHKSIEVAAALLDGSAAA